MFQEDASVDIKNQLRSSMSALNFLFTKKPKA